jgi:alkylation response protein AidB-like acyl-CoA dehydrogenase
VLDALRDAGLFRLLVPRSLGGVETDPVTCARIIEEVSRFDSATGWTLQAANSGDWYCARLPDEGAEEIYADKPDTVISLSVHPPMSGAPIDGGYRVSGQNELASNIHDADWLMTLIGLPDGTVRGVFIPTREVSIVDTWDSLGMRGTDSNDVAVADVFVPASRTWLLQPVFETGRHFQGPLYQYPSIGEGAFILPPVSLGVATAALAEFKRFAQQKTPFMSATPVRDRPVAQATLGRAEGLFRSARAYFYDTLTQAWERTQAGHASTREEKGHLLLAAVQAVRSAVEAVDLIFGLAGKTGIYRRSPLERCFRDVQTLRQHGWVSESRYQTVGQVLLGLAPDFPLAIFGPVADGE